MKSVARNAILALMCSSTFLLAQNNNVAPTKPMQGNMAGTPPGMSMQMPTPSPEILKLQKSIDGNWNVTEKHEPDPMMPNGGTGQGMAKIMPGPGNLSVLEHYHSSGGMGNFSGMGAFWWDAQAKAYRGVWCDNMTPNGCDASGTTRWEGDKLVGTMEMDMGGQKMMTRFTYSDFKPDSFTMTMEMGPNAGSMKKMMTFTYTRAAGDNKM